MFAVAAMVGILEYLVVVGVRHFITRADAVWKAESDGSDNSATLQLRLQYVLQGSTRYDQVELAA